MSLAASKKEVSLERLNAEHESLRKEFERDSTAVRENPQRRDEFVNRVDSLLTRLQHCVPNARTTAVVDAVSKIASEWQVIFTSELRIPKNVYESLKIDATPVDREASLSLSDRKPLTRETLEERIRTQAYFISKNWRVAWLRRLWSAFESHPEQIHAEAVRLPSRTAVDDWEEACVCLACDVLDSRIDLSIQISNDGFEFLESVWFEHVKRLKAYLHWESTQPEWLMDDPQQHYDYAIKQIYKQLLNSSIKGGQESFARIQQWIDRVVLDNGRLDTATRPYARRLVASKAHRVWQRTKNEDQDGNWRFAEEYVRDFYQNLVPAVTLRNRDSIDVLLDRCMFAPNQRGCEVVNALEVALVTYFVDAASIAAYMTSHSIDA